MIQIDNFSHPQLTINQWRIAAGQAWCVIGRNGSGKQLIDQLLMGELSDYEQQSVRRDIAKESVRLISFETQQAIYDEQMKLAANDLISEEESATPAIDFLPPDKLDAAVIDQLAMRHRLNARYTELSTGESRKLLLLQAILEGATFLILDNPFDSLDSGSCESLKSALHDLNRHGVTILLLLSNRQDIPDWCEHHGVVHEGALTVLDANNPTKRDEAISQALALTGAPQPDWPDTAVGLDDYPHSHLVTLRDCTVSFGGNVILDQLSLAVKPLQHTLITGENGSGKSTLLGLITGDCPQCFSNDVTVLGYRRGRGESVWDIKRNMGIVSNDLHRRYRVHCNVETAVCSGFFDSIGVYEPISDQQKAIAHQWLAAAGLGDRGQSALQSMSYGEQRLVLIARALVKSPLLLILDEPTQGLDELNRERLKHLLQVLDQRRHSTVIFVSHRQDEHLPLFQQHIQLTRLATQ